MATGPRYVVRFKRRRENRTNYRTRLALLKSKLTRLVVRISNTQVTCQFVKFEEKGDKTVAAVSSAKLADFGWKNSKKNLPAAYLTGLLVGKIAKDKKIGKVILDIGLQSKNRSRLFAVAKGAIDAGIDLEVGKELIPGEERIAGAHVSEQIQKDFKAAKTKIVGKKNDG